MFFPCCTKPKRCVNALVKQLRHAWVLGSHVGGGHQNIANPNMNTIIDDTPKSTCFNSCRKKDSSDCRIAVSFCCCYFFFNCTYRDLNSRSLLVFATAVSTVAETPVTLSRAFASYGSRPRTPQSVVVPVPASQIQLSTRLDSQPRRYHR